MKKILNLLTISMLASSTLPSLTQIMTTTSLLLKNNDNNLQNIKSWSMDSFIDHILMVYLKNNLAYMNNQKTNIKIDSIITNNKITSKKINEVLESTETSILKNETNLEQQISTQEYDMQVTNTYSVTNKIDIGVTDTFKIPFDEIKLNFNFSHSTTQTTSTSTTVKAPSQRINVAPDKKVLVNYDLYAVNYQNNYLLTVKLNRNATFSGNVVNIDGSTTQWKQFNFYQVLRSIGINKPDENNLMYATNDGLYYCLPLTLNTKGHNLNVDIKPEQPIN